MTTINDYLLVAIFSKDTDYLAQVKIVRSLTKAPILILKQLYDGMEKVAAIEAGADEYIQWPDTVEESVASGRALIRRCTGLNQQDIKTLNVLACGELFISADYRKVFINAQEVQFPRREFDLFYLLASAPGRVLPRNSSTGRYGVMTIFHQMEACTPVSNGYGASWKQYFKIRVPFKQCAV